MASIAAAADVFVHGGDCEDRFARVQRLVGERLLGTIQIGHIVGGEDRLDAGHGQRGLPVDVDARGRAASG